MTVSYARNALSPELVTCGKHGEEYCHIVARTLFSGAPRVKKAGPVVRLFFFVRSILFHRGELFERSFQIVGDISLNNGNGFSTSCPFGKPAEGHDREKFVVASLSGQGRKSGDVCGEEFSAQSCPVCAKTHIAGGILSFPGRSVLLVTSSGIRCKATFYGRSKIWPGVDPKHCSNTLRAESHDAQTHAGRRGAVREEAIAIVGDCQAEFGLVAPRTLLVRDNPGTPFALGIFGALDTRSRCGRRSSAIRMRGATEQFELDALRSSVRGGVVNGFLGDAIELESGGRTHRRTLQIGFESATDPEQFFGVRGKRAQGCNCLLYTSDAADE